MHNALERWRGRSVETAHLRRFFFENGRHRLAARVPLERSSSGEHLVEDRAEGKDVRAVIDALTAYLFG